MGGAVCVGALVDVVFVNVFEAGPVVVCCCLTMAAVGGLDLRPDCFVYYGRHAADRDN